MEIINMIVSKQKSNLAYAKICKDKSTHPPTPKGHTPQSHSCKNSKQNLYDELINDLQPDESGYINHLLTKQNKKTNKDREMNDPQEFLVDRSNKALPSSSHQKEQRHAGRKSSRKEASSHKIPSSSRKENQLGPTPFSELPPRPPPQQHPIPQSDHTSQQHHAQPPPFSLRTNKFRSQEYCSFISNITDYLNTLNQEKGQDGRFRRMTKHPPTEMQESQDESARLCWSPDPQDYKNLLNQLKQTMLANQTLEQKLEYKDHKLQEMKNIIQSLCGEIKHVKMELKNQTRQKNNYEVVFDDFAVEMDRARTSSKKEYASNKSLQRYSYVPLPRNVEEDVRHNRRSQLLQSVQFRNTYDYSQLNKLKEERNSLKKRGKRNNYRTSSHLYSHGSLASSEFPSHEAEAYY